MFKKLPSTTQKFKKFSATIKYIKFLPLAVKMSTKICLRRPKLKKIASGQKKEELFIKFVAQDPLPLIRAWTSPHPSHAHVCQIHST
jgi:hypothetical protein